MSGRKLGGGRVLGSGANLSPSPSPLAKQRHPNAGLQRNGSLQSNASLQPNAGLLSPSTSTISLDSSRASSTPPTDNLDQDLASRISLEQGNASPSNGAAAAAAAGSRLVCPICNEEMMTLLQLNRHLDDVHKNLEEVKQDEVKDWFRVQMVKAKKFQPLAVLNQKLKGLDVFESNDSPPLLSIPAGAASPTPIRSPELPRVDPNEVVTQAHWQRPGPSDVCAEPSCGARLNASNGRINCRKCGKLFCEEHTMYQLKLSRSAQHEPVRGMWCRVCETCYKSREGYNDHCFERDHLAAFKATRRKVVDKEVLEESRLEKRLTKLTQILANPPEQNAATGGLLWPLASMKNQRKELEQSVVVWEDDVKVPRCPFCQQDFQPYTFRRHHCRTCGRVVCGDPQTGCSQEVGFNVNAQRGSEKKQDQVSIDIRMCKDCRHTIFSRKDFAVEVNRQPPVVKAYDNLVQFERGIRILLPKFQRLLSALQDPDRPPSSAQLADASKVRKRLMDSFTQYDVAARRIRDMPTTSEAQRTLQKAVHQKGTAFLHTHMLPLKALPKVLKHASPYGSSSRPVHSRSGSALASVRYNDHLETSSQASSGSAISAMEEEEKQLRERLIVLEEQKFFVSEMVADANKKRRFDEVGALAANVQDLSREIDQIQGQLASLDFAGAYEQAKGDAGSRRGSAVRVGK